MNRVFAAILVVLGLSATACSSENEGNVFEGQVEAIEKAEEANRLLEEAAEAQRRAIDEQGR